MPDRKKHWEEIYLDKSPLEVSWFQKEPTLSLQLIRNARLHCNSPIIDVGGGASELVDHLCNKGYTNLAVLDISTKALAYAQNRLGIKANGVAWYTEDVTQFAPPHRFALWHDRAVFHFLTEKADRGKYVDVLKRTLEPCGHLIIAAFAIGGPTKCSGLDVVQYDAKKITAALGDGFELVEEKSDIHITPASKAQQFEYFRFIRKPAGS